MYLSRDIPTSFLGSVQFEVYSNFGLTSTEHGNLRTDVENLWSIFIHLCLWFHHVTLIWSHNLGLWNFDLPHGIQEILHLAKESCASYV